MPTTDATTNAFEPLATKALLGQGSGLILEDPAQFEVGLFTGDPTDTGATTDEVTSGVGYARKPIVFVEGTGADAGKLSIATR